MLCRDCALKVPSFVCYIQHVLLFRTFSSLERSSLVELSRDKDEGDAGIVGDNVPGVYISKDDIDATDSGSPYKVAERNKDFPQMSITVVLQGFSIGASLLPSLKVEYKVGVNVKCSLCITDIVISRNEGLATRTILINVNYWHCITVLFASSKGSSLPAIARLCSLSIKLLQFFNRIILYNYV